MKSLPDNLKIAVIGGDERQIYCAKRLSLVGFETTICGFENYSGDIGLCTKSMDYSDALNFADVVILPLPISRDSKTLNLPLSENDLYIESLFKNVRKETIIFGGNVTPQISETANKYGFRIVDYNDVEEFQIANAFLTAESAVGLAIKEMNFSVKDASVLVMGYGRIGKMLCHILKSMGVNVFASARKKRDFEWIRAFGYSPVNTQNVCSIISDCRLIFNTIPGLVLGEKELFCLPEDALVIDLASKPGGVNFEAAKKLGLKVIWALGLPGKCKPESAGKIVADTVVGILEDMEVI